MQGRSLSMAAFSLAVFFGASTLTTGQQEDEVVFEEDVIRTSGGELKIKFIGHGTLMFSFHDMIIHIDPVSREADYSKMPAADIILITHQHSDHLDAAAIASVSTDDTVVLAPETAVLELQEAMPIRNGETHELQGLIIEAVPAYNILHMRDTGEPFHPRGEGNGYVITFADTRVYVAGDTENVPEIKQLQDIDVAFLPMNLPYTMTPEMVADVAKALRPAILYPYHYGNTDPDELVQLLADEPGIEVRIRKMQ